MKLFVTTGELVTKVERSVTMECLIYKTTENCNYWTSYLHFRPELQITASVLALLAKLANNGISISTFGQNC